MNTLPTRRTLKVSIFILGPILLITTLIASFALLISGTNNTTLALDLATNSPQSLPHLVEYSLYRQAPPQGQVLGESITAVDGKASLLREYLEWQNSPLAPYAQTFIDVAQKYDLPWTLLPSICGKESTFGKQIPYESYNCWGWGIYGDQSLGFGSWEEAIDTVGKGLREDYFNIGVDTVPEIEYMYTPQSANSHHAWRDGVEYFQWEIVNFRELIN